jgi:hypothetical protein
MQTVTDATGWGSASQLILGPDPQLCLYNEVIIWFHKVELFRQQEEQRMYHQSPGADDLALHKRLLGRLLADGDHLARLIEQDGFLANAEGVTVADFKATLDNLLADYRGWHEPMAAEQRARILREVFHVAQPAP